MRPRELIAITTNVADFAMLVLTAVKRLQPLRPQLQRLQRDRLLAAQPSAASNVQPEMDMVAEIESLAHATLQAHTKFLATIESNNGLEITRKLAAALRKRLRADVKTLRDRGLLPASSLEGTRGVKGHRNVAFNLFALTNLLRYYWPQIKNRTATTAQELVTARELAYELASNAPPRTVDGGRALAAGLRAQAFTVLRRAYTELCQYVAFLAPDRCQYLTPPVYTGHRTRGRASPKEQSEQG